MDNICCIYTLTSPTNKIYIGQTRLLRDRFYGYKNIKCKEQKKLYRSLNKYGYDNHKVDIKLELEKNISQKELDQIEIFYIKYYKDLGFEVLNLTNGGSGKRQDKLFNITKEILEELYINNNLTKKEIAKIYNCKERLIKKYLTDFNIKKPLNLKLRKDEESRAKSLLRIHQHQVLSLKDKGNSNIEISKILGLPYHIVTNILIKENRTFKQKFSFKRIMDLNNEKIYSLDEICQKYNIKPSTLKEQFRLNRLKYNLKLI